MKGESLPAAIFLQSIGIDQRSVEIEDNEIEHTTKRNVADRGEMVSGPWGEDNWLRARSDDLLLHGRFGWEMALRLAVKLAATSLRAH
jgi:hypothetical protein